MNLLLQESLISTKNIQEALLIRRDDGKIKARTGTSLVISPATLAEIIAAFENPAETRERGLVVGKNAYHTIRADNSSIYGKTPSEDGVIIARTVDFVLFAVYRANMHPGIAVEAVEKLAEYFRKKGK